MVEVEPLPPIVLELEPIEAVTIPEAPTVRPAEEVGSARRSRPYTALWSGDHSDAKINELVNYYQHQTARINSGETLSNDEQWELDAVKSVLQKAGFSQYL